MTDERQEDFLLTYRDHENRKAFHNSKDCVVYQMEGTSEEEFSAYTRALREISGVPYDEQKIRDNLFCTFFCGSTEIHAYYTGHDRRARIVVDRGTKPYPKAEKESLDGGDAVLYQFELDHRRIDCGMCYIIKCRDGRFFMIDSAHMFSERDHIRIHEFLRRHTEEGKTIVIAGWFLSHAHQDHIVKFMDFVNEEFQDVELRDIYYNFPLTTVPGAERWSEGDKATMKEFELFMERHKEFSTIHLHTGQRFFVSGLKFTVLSTHEDLCSYPLECYNNASTVLMLEAGESRVLFLGDANYLACSEMTARYGKALKADIVQVAHHGFNGANAGIYYMVDARTALYATDQKHFESNVDSPSNQAVMQLCREYFVAGNGTVGLKLPYQPGTAVIFPKEIQ